MPLPFSIFSDYRAGLADSSAKTAPADAVGVVQEWLSETIAKEEAEKTAIQGILSSKESIWSDPSPAPVMALPVEPAPAPTPTPAPEPQAKDSLLFWGQSHLAQQDAITPWGQLGAGEAAQAAEPAPLPEVKNEDFSLPPLLEASRVVVASPAPEMKVVPKVPVAPAVAAAAFQESWPPNQAPNQISSRELSQLRVDMRQEIDEVKNDLFGAAMGVNALKDRLDGLESQVIAQAAQAAAEPAFMASPGPTRDEVHAWIREWLQAHLQSAVQAAVEKALETVAEQSTATLTSNEFFRMPIRPPGQDPVPLFSQAPLILSTRPS